jgi:hypothetical protein
LSIIAPSARWLLTDLAGSVSQLAVDAGGVSSEANILKIINATVKAKVTIRLRGKDLFMISSIVHTAYDYCI